MIYIPKINDTIDKYHNKLLNILLKLTTTHFDNEVKSLLNEFLSVFIEHTKEEEKYMRDDERCKHITDHDIIIMGIKNSQSSNLWNIFNF